MASVLRKTNLHLHNASSINRKVLLSMIIINILLNCPIFTGRCQFQLAKMVRHPLIDAAKGGYVEDINRLLRDKDNDINVPFFLHEKFQIIFVEDTEELAG